MENFLDQMRSILETTPRRWTELAAHLPADLLRRPPAAGEWSALECLQHIVDTETVFQMRLRYFLAGQDFPAFNPDAEGTKQSTEPAALARRFVELRSESLAALQTITPEDFPRRVRHSELGPVTMEEILHEWAAHDLMHTVQAERALMQPFIQGSGPWQKYFSDHVVEAA